MKMSRRTKFATGALLALVAAGAGAAVAVGGNDDGEAGATGPGADRAEAAGLSAHRATVAVHSWRGS